MYDKHLVKTIFGAAMGAQTDPLALVLFGFFFEGVYVLPANSNSRLKGVQDLFALFTDVAGVVHG
jgi:hypothetical protein